MLGGFDVGNIYDALLARYAMQSKTVYANNFPSQSTCDLLARSPDATSTAHILAKQQPYVDGFLGAHSIGCKPRQPSESQSPNSPNGPQRR